MRHSFSSHAAIFCRLFWIIINSLDIGVVPLKVQQFIAQVEALKGAAKICGAGAVIGDQAGAVLVLIEDEQALLMLCQQYGYISTPVVGEARGMHVVG